MRFLNGCLLSIVACVPSPRDASSASSEPGLYDPDPAHLWNRLHRALFIRTTADGREFGHDEVDPLLFWNTKHLLTGRTHEQAIGLLDEFLEKKGEDLIRDPVKRAILQHDLWAAFNWAARRPPSWEEELCRLEPVRRTLRGRLAKVIDRLALGVEELKALPDTYAAAVASKAFTPDIDAAHPDAAFLPPELFLAEGPWVCVGPRPAGRLDTFPPAAPTHASRFSDRSAFLVFMRLPGGRGTTLAYLKQLREFPRPCVIGTDGQREANPELPQFPVGTQVALVRQMILIDKEGHPVPSRLTESVQFRAYREVSKNPQGFNGQAAREQKFFQLDLDRARLFALEAGGLRPVGDRKDLHDGGDPFEPTPEDGHFVPLESREPRLRKCAGCHTGGGIFSVKSYYPNFNFGLIDSDSVPRALASRKPEDEANAAAARLDRSHDFGILRGLVDK